MIDLKDLQFNYSKEEVDSYLKENNVTIEELLDTLIHSIKTKARVPISHFQVGAAAFTSKGRIFLGTNIEIAYSAINHTVHAEQCTLSNMFLHSYNCDDEYICILAVTETPCGHCRQILQELPHASDIRVIVKKVGIDCLLKDLLPFIFELPIDGIVHHVNDNGDHMIKQQDLSVFSDFLESEIYPLFNHILLDNWKMYKEQIMQIYYKSFAWYSGCPAIALFLSKTQLAIGGIIESSAYNPTVNPLQMAIIDCQLKDIPYSDLIQLILIEKQDCIMTYEGQLKVLSKCLPNQFTKEDRIIPYSYKQFLYIVCFNITNDRIQ